MARIPIRMPSRLAGCGLRQLLVAGLLVLAACASRPAVTTSADSADARPMVAPVAPPPSPDFNVKSATPLGVPPTPSFGAVPPLAPPPAEMAAMVPLGVPSEPALSTMPVVTQPPVPQQRTSSLPRPPEPPPTVVTTLPPSALPPALVPAAVPVAAVPVARPPVAPSPALPLPAETRLLFDAHSPELPAGAATVLDRLVDALLGSEQARLQLRAYAGGSADAPIDARKLSLTRALKVRDYLAGRGVETSRVDLRPLGLAGGSDGPADRVDIVPAN